MKKKKNYQLKIAKAITSELLLNEESCEKWEYDFNKSEIIRNILDKLKFTYAIDDIVIIKSIPNLNERYNKLSTDSKIRLLRMLEENLEEIEEIDEQEKKLQICNDEGHIYSKWKKREITTLEDSWYDHERVKWEKKEIFWERKCKRCNEIEKSETIPQEVIEEKELKSKMRKEARERALYNELKKKYN